MAKSLKRSPMANGPLGAISTPLSALGANGASGPSASGQNVPIGVMHNGSPVGLNPQGLVVPLSSVYSAATGMSASYAGMSAFYDNGDNGGLNLSVGESKAIFIKQLKKMFENDDSQSIHDLVDEAFEQYLVESVIDS